MFSRKVYLATAALFTVLTATHQVRAGDNDENEKEHGNGNSNGNDNGNGKKKDRADPFGAWFGVARLCPADAATDSPVHAAFCTSICNGACAASGLLSPEIAIMPSILEDGTLLADDTGQIGITGTANNYHTTAHGAWTGSEND